MKGRAVKWLGVLGSAALLLLALSTGTRVMAQQYFGIVVGTITDPSGAAVPDCTVTAEPQHRNQPHHQNGYDRSVPLRVFDTWTL